ncbi:MAG: TonB-dependent receptor [Desulfobacterales bacterium]|nr:TonB-dependent receptor [Desulfobacterales bacterium]
MKNFRIYFVTRIFIAALMTVFCFSPGVFAEKPGETEELDLSLGDLLNLQISVATKTEMTMEEAPSIVSVITGEEIKNMGARNMMDVMRIVPGFDFYQSHAVHAAASYIRGLAGKYKLLINGHGIGIDGVGIIFDKIPVASIKKIEIIRGPGSALYGAGAFLGVINIITKQGGDEPSRVSFEGGSDNTLKHYAEFSYNENGFRMYLLADHYKTDGYDGIVESDMATDTSSLASHAPNAITEGGNHVNVQANIGYKNFYFTGMFQKIDYEVPIGIASALTDHNECRDTFAFGEFGYELPINDKGDLLFKGYYDYHIFKRVYEIFSYETGRMDEYTGFPKGEGLFGSPRDKQSVLGGEITANYEVFSGIGLVGGFSYEYLKVFDIEHYANHNLTGSDFELNGEVYDKFLYKYFPGGMTDISENGNWLEEADRTIAALYVQGSFDLKKLFSLEKGVKGLSLTAGVRYDNYDDMGSTTNPRLGLVYAPTEKLYFKGLYGTAFRAPGWSAMYAKNNPAYVGNKDVGPENIKTFECLIGYNFTNNIKSSVTFYHMQAEDLIEGAQGTYKNIGKLESQGVEAEIKLVFDRFRYACLNAAYQDVMDTTLEDYFPGNVPEFYGNIGVNWDFFDEHVVANLSLNYMGERKKSGEKVWKGEELKDKDTRDSVDAYALLNASLTFRNFFRGLEFQVNGFNLLDDDVRDPVPNVKVKNYLPRPGRTLTCRISYSF